jgi:hypothetical protein
MASNVVLQDLSPELDEDLHSELDTGPGSTGHLICEVSRHVAKVNGHVRNDADWEAVVGGTSQTLLAVLGERPFTVVSNDRFAEFFVGTEADRQYFVQHLPLRWWV